MTNASAYLSTTDGKWTVILSGSPACANTTRERAEAVARHFRYDPTTLPIWDGNAGSFVRE
jgi:hypothetical protein